MAKSLATLREQISRLQKEADAMQQGVILRIRKEIAQYELTPEQLFGAAPKAAKAKTKPAKAAKAVKAVKAAKVAKSAKAPKFADDAGHTWGGMGKRPEWLREALAAGRSIDEFRIAGKAPVATAPAARKKSAASGKKTAKARAKPRRAKAEAPASEA